MERVHRRVISALMFSFLVSIQAGAQQPLPTRITLGVAPILSQPKEEFSRNVGNGFGVDGAFLYHLDRSGILSLRFDASGSSYGRETKRVPFSATVGGRILVDATTTNSMMAFGFGPELAFPRGPVRPYVNAGLSGLLFRTSSSVKGLQTSEDGNVSTTNHSDGTRAWVFGSGVRIPLPARASSFSLDLGLRYHRGGPASYLREGSIQDRPDGSIDIAPLNSRTPYMAYLIGIRFRIPYNSSGPCPRFLC